MKIDKSILDNSMLEKVIRMLYNVKQEYDKLCELPDNYVTTILNDNYVEVLHTNLDEILLLCFPEYYDDIEWFIWEWKVGYKIDDVVINDVEDFINYIKVR